VGPVRAPRHLTYAEEDGEVFLAAPSPSTSRSGQDARRHRRGDPRLIDGNYERARDIVTAAGQAAHHAEALIRYETIDEHQIKDIMDGRTRGRCRWEDTAPDRRSAGRQGRAVARSSPAASQH